MVQVRSMSSVEFPLHAVAILYFGLFLFPTCSWECSVHEPSTWNGRREQKAS